MSSRIDNDHATTEKGDSITMFYPQCEGGSSINKNWYRMICSAYATRKLSYESDRLPDSSRLVSAVAAKGGGVYCAGIWWKDLAYGICWYDFDLRLPSLLRPSKYLAPSWLWTSALDRIEFSKELPQPITLCYSWRAGKLLVLWHCRHSQWRPTRATA